MERRPAKRGVPKSLSQTQHSCRRRTLHECYHTVIFSSISTHARFVRERIFTSKGNNKMNRRIATGLTLLAGVAIGATTIQGLHAQAKPPTYVVVAIRKISDADSFKSILPKYPATIEAAGGHFVVRTDKITDLDGTPPQRFILLQFDSPEKAQAWHNSAATKELDAIRLKSTDSLSFIVEGMSQ
jgi:uncharacterized protein (DUF1330 family)